MAGTDVIGQWCQLYEAHHRDSKDLLFSCPVFDEGFETYNCLYFEILATYLGPDDSETTSDRVPSPSAQDRDRVPRFA